MKALSARMDSHFRIVYWTLGVLVAAFLGLLWRVLSYPESARCSASPTSRAACCTGSGARCA